MLMDRSPVLQDEPAGKEEAGGAVLSQDIHLMHMNVGGKSPQKPMDNSLEAPFKVPLVPAGRFASNDCSLRKRDLKALDKKQER